MKKYLILNTLLLCGIQAFAQEAPDYSICEEIKKLDPNASAETYREFFEKMQKNSVNTAACGSYILFKKSEKAYKQIASEYNFSDEVIGDMKSFGLAYSCRPSASNVRVKTGNAVQEEVRRHMLNTVKLSKEVRMERFPTLQSNVATQNSESLDIKAKYPEYTFTEDYYKKHTDRTFSVNKNNQYKHKIIVDKNSPLEEQKGAFNHELGHYFFGDHMHDILLSNIFFGKNIHDLIQAKNGIQKFYFVQEYRADWFIGLVSPKSDNFEYTKKSLESDYDIGDIHPNDEHPPMGKRIDWLSRWIKLKQAEEKSQNDGPAA
ncbi:MAG: hypothetical protein WC707_06545 [Candidatus Babeliaceae bacterium]|jgi:hypothetical protein